MNTFINILIGVPIYIILYYTSDSFLSGWIGAAIAISIQRIIEEVKND